VDRRLGAARSEDPHAASPSYPEAGVDLTVEAARGLRLKNPVMTASGTFGQGVEYAELFDVSRLGAIVNKGTTPAARPGNPQYRIAETPSGILNSIGLENPGAAEVARKYGKAWAELGVAVIVNVAGYSVDDYVFVVHEMTGTPGVVAYEINVSCPNVKGGMLFGCDPDLAAEVTRAVKAETDLPVIVKLTPNAPDVVAVARACEEAGADALTAINTVLGMRIDTRRRRPILGTGSGGLSGPAIRPIAVHITYQVAQAVSIDHRRGRRHECAGRARVFDGRGVIGASRHRHVRRPPGTAQGDRGSRRIREGAGPRLDPRRDRRGASGSRGLTERQGRLDVRRDHVRLRLDVLERRDDGWVDPAGIGERSDQTVAGGVEKPHDVRELVHRRRRLEVRYVVGRDGARERRRAGG